MSTSGRTTVSNKHFCLYSLGLLILWAVVIATSPAAAAVEAAESTSNLNSADSSASAKDVDKKNTRNCQALCGHCGCMSFYCGEECICECNNENSDTECIGVMQSNARKLRIPFELIIQGPTTNRFVRNALQFEQNTERLVQNNPFTTRNKRSTVVIYKPTAQNSLDDEGTHYEKVHTNLADDGLRNKRAITQLEWFSDLANNLVRPAPIAGNSRKAQNPTTVEEESAATKKRSPFNKPPAAGGSELDRSWFTDNSKILLKPSPLFKRQSRNPSTDDGQPDMPILDMGKQVLKETLKNFKDTGINEEFSDVLTSRIRDGSEIIKDQIHSNFEFFPKTINNAFEDTIQHLKSFRTNVVEAPSPPPTASSGLLVPWLRPVRFLQRVQQVIR